MPSVLIFYSLLKHHDQGNLKDSNWAKCPLWGSEGMVAGTVKSLHIQLQAGGKELTQNGVNP